VFHTFRNKPRSGPVLSPIPASSLKNLFLQSGASITLEPGGQLELSGAPVSTLHETMEELKGHLDEVSRYLPTFLGTELGPLPSRSIILTVHWWLLNYTSPLLAYGQGGSPIVQNFEKKRPLLLCLPGFSKSCFFYVQPGMDVKKPRRTKLLVLIVLTEEDLLGTCDLDQAKRQSVAFNSVGHKTCLVEARGLCYKQLFALPLAIV
jgi:hypothetical protein